VAGLFGGFGHGLRLVSGDKGVDFFFVLSQYSCLIEFLIVVKVKFPLACLHNG
jgi:hypothetical protein